MQYGNIDKAVFLARPNRFIAHVRLEGGAERVICHVKNTGRCRELLTPGAAVYVEKADNPARKTQYDLIAVEKPDVSRETSVRLINMDAQAPNKVFQEWAAGGGFLPNLKLLRPETTWGNSRFDFYYELSENGGGGPVKGFVEVKGVTLEEGGAAYFPDAPTERGVKHVEELMALKAAGYGAHLCFVVQMEGVSHFSPNDRTHPAFGAALRRAEAAGVELLAVDCAVTPDSLTIRKPVEIRL